MKTAIVYYSMNGNTAMVAGELAKHTGADLIGIRPEKAYPDKGLRKFLRGGKSAVMGEAPKLMPYTFHADEYDQVVIGFPVWAGNITPPIRTFVLENRDALKEKRVCAFACQGGSGGEKAFRKLRECLGRNTLEATVILIDPKDKPRAENDRLIAEFREKL